METYFLCYYTVIVHFKVAIYRAGNGVEDGAKIRKKSGAGAKNKYNFGSATLED